MVACVRVLLCVVNGCSCDCPFRSLPTSWKSCYSIQNEFWWRILYLLYSNMEHRYMLYRLRFSVLLKVNGRVGSILIHIWDSSGSNLGPETDWVVSWFSQSLQEYSRITHLIGHSRFLPYTFHFIIYSISCHLMVNNLRCSGQCCHSV
jgi:hypothetical protein